MSDAHHERPSMVSAPAAVARQAGLDALGPDRVFGTVREAVRANASEPRRYLLNPAVSPLRSWRRPMA